MALSAVGWADAVLHPLAGDASTRRYIRVAKGGRTAMLMDQPQLAETQAAPAGATPEERRALGYNALARLAGADCARYAAVAAYLRKAGLSAPDVFAADTGRGLLLMEDLGDNLYAGAIASGADETELYESAADALVQLHAAPAPATLNGGMTLFPYDETAFLAETELLTEWFLPAALGRRLRRDEASEHRAMWQAALAPLAGTQHVFVHRDYHAQNLIWLPAREGIARVGMLDFQDAVAGSAAYDLVSLVEDARRDVAPELAAAMTARYLRLTGADAEAFGAAAAILAAQRNAKIIGIFTRLAKRDRKPRYLGLIPRVWGYMEKDLQHPALAELKAWYEQYVPARARRGELRSDGDGH